MPVPEPAVQARDHEAHAQADQQLVEPDAVEQAQRARVNFVKLPEQELHGAVDAAGDVHDKLLLSFSVSMSAGAKSPDMISTAFQQTQGQNVQSAWGERHSFETTKR